MQAASLRIENSHPMRPIGALHYGGLAWPLLFRME
jgi:hypothetical protein